jgi:hypothetical protein
MRRSTVVSELITATERLGWPKRRWRDWLLWPAEYQDRLIYEDEADTPTATCHLQVAEDEPALCGYRWEGLIPVPGNPPFESLDDWLRCDECADAAQQTNQVVNSAPD